MGGASGGDCSDRICPYELAWVDSPDKDGKTHKYAECAAKGICDRESGECECFPGFEGTACARQACPDSCSGHGTCEYMNELAFGTVFNDYYDGSAQAYWATGVGAVRPSTDYSWDASRARACVCDAGWTGINCASRMCPYGNDVMDTRLDRSDTLMYQVQTITLYSGGTTGGQDWRDYAAGTAKYPASITDFQDKSFALRFTSKTNETYTTVPIGLVANTNAAARATMDTAIENALTGLPNQVINGVSVNSDHTNTLLYGEGMNISITFTGSSVHGQQNLLEVVTNPCSDGCTPLITGLADQLVSNTNSSSYVIETTAADYNSFECGRRGKCDYDTGLCSCFEGYTGEACTSLTALI
jgi:hypothetical protein